MCLLRDEATMHFDILLNFLATRKMCTILRVEEILLMMETISVLWNAVAVATIAVTNATATRCTYPIVYYVLERKSKSCEATRSNVINIKFCLSLYIYFVDAIVLFSVADDFFFSFWFSRKCIFHPSTCSHAPFCFCTVSLFQFSMLSLLFSFSFN